MSDEDRRPAPDQGAHDPEMTDPDEANAPDVAQPDQRKLTREIDEEGDESA